MKNTERREISINGRQPLRNLFQEPYPENQIEKDIRNLKYMCYSIRYGGFEYRMGFVSTLRRAIKLLESSQPDLKKFQTHTLESVQDEIHKSKIKTLANSQYLDDSMYTVDQR